MNMKISKQVCILLGIFVFLALFPLNIQKVDATTLTVTRTFQSLTSDGTLNRWSATESYADIWSATSGSVFNVSSQINVGQYALFQIYRAFLPFDTSSLPDACNITSVNLSLYLVANSSTQDFNVTVQNGQPTYPHLPLVVGDYYKGFYSGAGGSRNTSTITALNYWNVTLNSTGIAWIDVDGTSKLCLRSDRDIAGIEPSTYEFIVFYSTEKGASYAPILYVTYETEGYRYIVHGPYYESGAVAPCLVNITLAVQNMASNSTFLNGTDGSADTLTFEIEQRGISLVWNISLPTFNESRIFTLTDATFEEIYVYIPNSGEVYNLYLVNIFDLAGLTDATVETQINVAGFTRTVERHNLDVSNPMPFYLSWAHSYGLKITSNQGSYTWQITPTSEQTITKIAEKGMFPITLPGQNLTVLAGRMNDTWIQVNYTDAESLTSWVNVIIKHRLTGGTWLTDYSFNQTGHTVQVNWYSADSDTDYRVIVQAMRNGTQIEHTAFCQALAATSNPWDNAFTDLFDDLPFPAKNLVGIAIVFFFAGIFSVADRVLGAFMVVIVAALMTYIGMLDLSWTLIGTVMFIVVLAGIEESKQRQHQ